MNQECDLTISRLTVRLTSSDDNTPIGSGVIFYNEILNDKVYILTAAHNLYTDGDSFSQPLNIIIVDIIEPKSNFYKSLRYKINYNLVSPDEKNDVAVLLFDKKQIQDIIRELPDIYAIKENPGANFFTVKGFPRATFGEELASIQPKWIQNLPGTNEFQLQLTEDYLGWSTEGFSGSGVFVYEHSKVFLHGIFTRFREEEKGKVIYCQSIDSFNNLLARNFLPKIPYTFFGKHGLTGDFFNQQVKSAISNLGPRFNEKLNFRLPVAQIFNDLAKDENFKKRTEDAIDKWLLARSFKYNTNNKLLAQVENKYREIKGKIKSWISSVNWHPDTLIEFDELESEINQFNRLIEEERNKLYTLVWEEEKRNKSQKKEYTSHSPYENEKDRLYDLSRINHQLLEDLDEVNFNLANYPYLIIKGVAGCGKSHLLGDIANERIKNGEPTILLLGQLFKENNTVWQNILIQLNLSCSKNKFLDSLNSIGKQISSRVIILIDAINEGAGKKIWSDEIAGLIEDISNFPFIGIAFSIRTTYFKSIIPEQVKNNKNVTILTHEGFKGNEYAALNLFCEHYELSQPHFPILNPEFSNPLFLHLICEAVKNSGKTQFPQGFHGVRKLFEYYLDSIINKLAEKRELYKLRQHKIKTIIKKLAIACFEQKDRNALKIQDAQDWFDTEYPQFVNLLDDLILENVLIQTIFSDYQTNEENEIIHFSFERFADFLVAEELLKSYKFKESVKIAFGKNNSLGKLLIDGYWRFEGLMEAFAILLPEKYNLEITEVFDWVFDSDHEQLLGNINEYLCRWLMESLKWREIKSINVEKLNSIIGGDNFYIDYNSYLIDLIELSAYSNHPFNSDRFFNILNHYSLPERDAFWQEFLRFFSHYNDYNEAFPIRRLIDWAWHPGISQKTDKESARLVGQTLVWVLSSSFISLRDEITKALVNLLYEQTDSLIHILNKFKDVNDPYILERLYGVAYGCTLRTSSDESVLKVAQFVFDQIFREGNPPAHILLRDYARNIVEYAVYKELLLLGDIYLIKSPYNSKMPENIPSAETIEKYNISHESSDFRDKFGSLHNRIIHSVMEWDFGRYIVDSALRSFYPVSFTFEYELKKFKNNLPRKLKENLNLFISIHESKTTYTLQKEKYQKVFSEDKFKMLISSVNQLYDDFYERLIKNFKAKDKLFFQKQVLPHLDNKARIKDWQRNFFSTRPIRRWIVQRVFELGYDSEKHGSYDSSAESFSFRSSDKIERIGKKYQWIAFYEIMAMIADNYKYEKDSWGSEKKYDYFKGPWQDYLRNIDPVFITKNNKKSDIQDYNKLPWWLMDYNHWNLPDSKWVNEINDLPAPQNLILREDENNEEWIYLKTHLSWTSPKPIGQERYEANRKEIWYMLQGYLVYKKDKNKIVKWLKQQNFFGRWLPESNSAISGLFSRENYWSPASKDNEKERWSKINEKGYKVLVTTSEAVGNVEKDKSGAHFKYEMPCKKLFEGMNLQYATNDGEFKNEDEEIVVINPDYNGILVKKNHLINYLQQNNLDIIWTLLGEKNVIEGNLGSRGNNIFKVINGVYYLENEIISGSLILSNRE